jgi:hypothetical protein
MMHIPSVIVAAQPLTQEGTDLVSSKALPEKWEPVMHGAEPDKKRDNTKAWSHPAFPPERNGSSDPS